MQYHSSCLNVKYSSSDENIYQFYFVKVERKSEREVAEGEDKPRDEHQQSQTALQLETLQDGYSSYYGKFPRQGHSVGNGCQQPPMGEPAYLAPADIKRLRSASTVSTSSSGSDISQVREGDSIENSFDHPEKESKQKDKIEAPVCGLQVCVTCKQARPNSSMPVLIGFCVC